MAGRVCLINTGFDSPLKPDSLCTKNDAMLTYLVGVMLCYVSLHLAGFLVYIIIIFFFLVIGEIVWLHYFFFYPFIRFMIYLHLI